MQLVARALSYLQDPAVPPVPVRYLLVTHSYVIATRDSTRSSIVVSDRGLAARFLRGVRHFRLQIFLRHFSRLQRCLSRVSVSPKVTLEINSIGTNMPQQFESKILPIQLSKYLFIPCQFHYVTP